MTTPVVSIAYHSGYGHTALLAEAVRAGAAGAGAEVYLIKVDEITDAQWEALDGSDAIVFGSPTCMGTTASEYDLNRLGVFAGAAAQTNVDEGPEAVHKADLATAEHLGRRVAETARTFLQGRAAA
ncbi:flavodoxin domain-containing protein [Streptomyces sp. NPDC001443]